MSAAGCGPRCARPSTTRPTSTPRSTGSAAGGPTRLGGEGRRAGGGQGVVVTDDRDTARVHAAALLDSGHPVLLESFLDGPEVSLFCLVDGPTVVPCCLPRTSSGSATVMPGPTPGDGRLRAAAVAARRGEGRHRRRRGGAGRGRTGAPRRGFSGLLYAGLAMTSSGPAVVEFNCRFGDPETQAVLALLKSPLGQLLYATATGTLADFPAAVAGRLRGHRRAGRRELPRAGRVGDVITGSEADGVLRGHHPARRRRRRLVRRPGALRRRNRAPTCLPRAGRLPGAVRNRVAGGHFRSDIGLAAAEGRIALP